MERQKKRAVILYALAAALLAFYAFVLVTGLHYSGDSEAYRYYYLDKSVDRYIPDRMLQEEYTANREIPFETEDGTGNTGNGWSGTQDNGRRMTGVRAEFYICCTDAPQGSYELVIRRINEAGGGEKLTVNGKEAGELAFAGNEARVSVPAEWLAEGLNTFELSCEGERAEKDALYVGSVGLYHTD